MRKMVFAVPLALASALALSACDVSINDSRSRDQQETSRSEGPDGTRATPQSTQEPDGDNQATGGDNQSSGGNESGTSGGAPLTGGAVSNDPVQQPGESTSNFTERSGEYDSVSSGSQFTYDCNNGPWSSTDEWQTVVLRGHCTDVNVTHKEVDVWVPQADRVNMGADSSYSTVVANQIGALTIAGTDSDVYTGALGDVTVGGNARWTSIYTGTIGSRVTIQGYETHIYYDQGFPSVTNTGDYTDVEQN